MYEIASHTADVRIHIENKSLEGLFADAGHGVIAFCEVRSGATPKETLKIVVESIDRTSLLVDFLNELVAMLHIDRLAFSGFEHVSIEETRLEGSLTFTQAKDWSEDIKAVTYHEANVTKERDVWKTTIVLDI